VRGHDTPTVGLSELNSLDRLGDGTNLVDLEEKSVTSLLLDSGLDSEGVGNGKIVTDNLDLSRGVKSGPRLPVVLVKGVLNGDDVVLLDVSLVDFGELSTGEGLGLVRVGVLSFSFERVKSKILLTLKSRSYLPSL